MNERIKELEDQCWEDNPNTGPVVFNREKFAELIVRECAEVGVYHGGNVRYLILNNFGLKQ